MRTLATLLFIGCAALTGCVGEIGGDDANGNSPSGGGPPKTTNGAFTCDPAATALTPSNIHRLAKVYVVNAINEFLSQYGDSQRTALVAAIQTRLDLIPTDGSDYYTTNDNTISQDHVDAIFGLAVALGTKISDDASGFTADLMKVCGAGSTKASLAEDACLTSFVQYYGRKSFRRPLAQAEIDDFKGFYNESVTAGADGLAALVGRFIAHPNFYYRFDSEGSKVSGTDGQDAIYQLTQWELLSKITFLFWAAPPTDELYDRVAKTDITKDDALASLVDDVIADPKAAQGLLGFYKEWLQLEKTKMPGTDGNIAAGAAIIKADGIDSLPATHRDDMNQEVLDLAKHYTLSTDGKLDDILTSQYSFAKTQALATIYGVAPWDGSPDHLVALPKGERSGLATRAAMVASNAEYTRPIIKGRRVRTQLLCNVIPLPPPNLDIKPLTHPVDKTTRQAVDEATADAKCAACHHLMNPIGFLSENYDPLGRVRDKELRFADGTGDIVAELPLDTHVSLTLHDGGETKDLTDAAAMSQYLASTGEVHTCMVRNFFEFVSGRVEDDKLDGCDLAGMRERLTASDGSIKGMLREAVLVQSFRQRKVK